MDTRARNIIEQGNRLFELKRTIDTYHQELAEQFYPERADFTTTRTPGDYMTDLMSSEPVMIRRELANLLQAMLRPESQEWFGIHVADEKTDKDAGLRKWLEWMTTVQRRAMYHAPANFSRATKEGDNDWVTFGQTVIEVDLHPDRSSLLYRCGHLRDHAWTEGVSGAVDAVHRKWNPTARQLARMFRGKVHSRVSEAAEREPETTIKCRRFVLPRADYDMAPGKSPNALWASVYVDVENETILEEVPLRWLPYVVPRWQTVSGSQYAWSPCTGPGLADARTLQALVRILLEAGEKAVDPPMIAIMDAIRSDIAVYAGGVTSVDVEYDERTGEALRPLAQDRSGLPIGIELADRARGILTEGFFLNKLTLPQDVGKMTAYEVRKRLEEHIRASAPILTPAEEEYSGALCDRTFEVLRTVQAFGPESDIPQALKGQEVRFEFRSPIRDISEELKGQTLLEAMQILGPISEIDPAQMAQLDLDTATEDALRGIGVPAAWLSGKKAVKAAKKQMAQQQQAQAAMQQVQQGAMVAEQVGKAGQSLAAIGKAA